MNLVLVFLGGGLGSVSRVLISKYIQPLWPSFPYATLISNGLSCFILGLIIGAFSHKIDASAPLKYFFILGFCGGFSTYSSFTLETLELFKSGYLLAAINILGNFILCVAMIGLGVFITRFFN